MPIAFQNAGDQLHGDASVCCVDWSHETSVSNALETPIAEIWNGAALREFRLKHLRNARNEIDACRNCQYIKGTSTDSVLDDHAAELVKVYEE